MMMENILDSDASRGEMIGVGVREWSFQAPKRVRERYFVLVCGVPFVGVAKSQKIIKER